MLILLIGLSLIYSVFISTIYINVIITFE
jgi:hypothetical protein